VETVVALVDEYEVVIEGLTRAFDQERGLRVGDSWRRLDTAFDAWTVDRPCLAVLEHRLLGLDPVASLEAIRDTLGVPVLVRARQPNAELVQLLLDAGAYGVVGATASAADTVKATRAVLEQGTYVPPALRDDLHVRRMRRIEVPYMTLSRRERQVAALAVSGSTAKEVAERLSIALPTVRSHLKHAYAKLGVRGQTEALFLLIGLGVGDPDRLDHARGCRPRAA